MTWVSKTLTFLGIAASLVIAAGTLLYIYQNNMLYYPTPPGFPKTPDENPEMCRSPGEWAEDGRENMDGRGIPFEEQMLETPDGQRIHIWLMLNENSTEVPTLIYFHGNAGNMGFRLQNAVQMYAEIGINVLMMDYRGYGKSSGIPSEAGIKIDAETVLQYAASHPKLLNSPLVVFGRSLGGAVCMALAEKFPDLVKAIVVENTFLSVPAMVDRLMPWVAPLKSLVLHIGWKNDELVGKLKQPMLFISGDSDELVPPRHMKQLHDMAEQSSHRDFFSVSGGTHNDTWYKAGGHYSKRLKEFFIRTVCPALAQHRRKIVQRVSNDHRGAGSEAAIPTMQTNFDVK